METICEFESLQLSSNDRLYFSLWKCYRKGAVMRMVYKTEQPVLSENNVRLEKSPFTETLWKMCCSRWKYHEAALI